MSLQTAAASPRYPHNGPSSSRSSRPPPTPSVRGGSFERKQASTPLLSPQHAQGDGLFPSGLRSPSPSYFGFHIPEANDGSRQNPIPSSVAAQSVQSTAAFSPTVIPVDQDSQYAAFRRVSEGATKAFNLGDLNTSAQMPSRAAASKDTGSTRHSPKDMSDPQSMPPPARPSANFLEPDPMMIGRSPKRHLSSDSTSFPPPPRKTSPASYMQDNEAIGNSQNGSPERHPRTSLPPKQVPSFSLAKPRADTLPASLDADTTLVTPQHVINLLEADAESILLLDLRVSTQYAKSRISGALNLCIPTTLIKRPSFNVQKLAETFKDKEQRQRFENWRSSKYIIVYDAMSEQMKDAQVPLSTVRKFESEGYEGTVCIIRGGITAMSKQFPSHIDKGMTFSSRDAGVRSLSLPGSGATIPPVIGGCELPAAKTAVNPFFGNIRQNMDLIGGVGQQPVTRPKNISAPLVSELPPWLRIASEEGDKGAKVADKFLQIEKREQKRMQDALSGKVSYGTPTAEQPKSVMIAGIEKGNKNRYNNIWPFEHSRVKLQGVPNHGCDYFNANHIKSSLSNKRYIATQGPIPATFADFWNVVWQQDVRVIVMLTAEKEGGQIKAHNYWNEKQYGPFSLELLSERKASLEPHKINRHRSRPGNNSRNPSSNQSLPIRTDSLKDSTASSDQPFVLVRKMTISHENEPFARMREITQLQYSSWPDFGAPAHPTQLLGLVEQTDAVARQHTGAKHGEPDPPNAPPILVHCSAGCGRTGTFCTVDSVIDMMKRQRSNKTTKTRRQLTPMDIDSDSPFNASNQSGASPFFPSTVPSLEAKENHIDGNWLDRDDLDLIEKTVEEFRLQRLSMVQSLRQFVLCYESVLEWIVEMDRLDHEEGPAN